MYYNSYLTLFALLLLSLPVFAQDQEVAEKPKPKLELGVLLIYNDANEDLYARIKSRRATDNGEKRLAGVNLKLTFPTKYKYLDIIAGSLIIKDGTQYAGGSFSPGSFDETSYNINGGGVYAGISPKLKGKFIGLTSDLAVGVFSFKEYSSVVDYTSQPIVDEHDLKASYGLGAMTSVGMYLKVWKIGINPSLIAIFSGGAETSFLFYGFNLPLTYQF